MEREEATFEFHGREVQIDVRAVGHRWTWSYAIDGRVSPVVREELCLTRRAAFEDAGMAARDQIRTMRDPSWRSAAGSGLGAVARAVGMRPATVCEA